MTHTYHQAPVCSPSVLPGTDMAAACAVTIGETPALAAFPILPARGRLADRWARTFALMGECPATPSVRAWQLTARKTTDFRRACDLTQRDWDEFIAAASGKVTPTGVLIPVIGPISLAASVELPNGHVVMTDPGATRDVAQMLAVGLANFAAQVRRELDVNVALQFDEPLLGQVIAGTIKGAHEFEDIPARDPQRLATFYQHVVEFYRPLDTDSTLILNQQGTPIVSALSGKIDTLATMGGLEDSTSAQELDTLGELFESPIHTIFAPRLQKTPRDTAIRLAHLVKHLGLSPVILSNTVTFTPRQNTASTLKELTAVLKHLTEVADICRRDATDLLL